MTQGFEGRAKGCGAVSSPTTAQESAGDGQARKGPVIAGGALPEEFLSVEAGLPLDLLGDPVRPGAGRKGRPCHLPTPESREMVAAMHRAGEGQSSIALALGITIPTLVLNYPSELESNSRAWMRRKGRSDET